MRVKNKTMLSAILLVIVLMGTSALIARDGIVIFAHEFWNYFVAGLALAIEYKIAMVVALSVMMVIRYLNRVPEIRSR